MLKPDTILFYAKLIRTQGYDNDSHDISTAEIDQNILLLIFKPRKPPTEL